MALRSHEGSFPPVAGRAVLCRYNSPFFSNRQWHRSIQICDFLFYLDEVTAHCYSVFTFKYNLPGRVSHSDDNQRAAAHR